MTQLGSSSDDQGGDLDYTLHVRHVTRRSKLARVGESQPSSPPCDVNSGTDSDATICNVPHGKSKTSTSRGRPRTTTQYGVTPRYLSSGVDPEYTDQLIQQVAKMTQADTETPCDVNDLSHNAADDSDVYAASSVSSFLPAKVKVRLHHGGRTLETREEEIDSLFLGRGNALVCDKPSRLHDRHKSPKHTKRERRSHSGKRHSAPTPDSPAPLGHSTESAELSRVRRFMSKIIDDLHKEGKLEVPQQTVTEPCTRSRKDSGITPDHPCVPPTGSPKRPGLPPMTTDQLSPDQLYDGSRLGVLDLQAEVMSSAVEPDGALKEAITQIVYDTMKYYHSRHPEHCPPWDRPSDPEAIKHDLDCSFDSTAYDSGHGSSAYSEFNESFPDPLAEVATAADLAGDELPVNDLVANDLEEEPTKNIGLAEPIYETIPEVFPTSNIKLSCVPELRNDDLCDPLDNTYERITDLAEDMVPPDPPALPARNYPRSGRPRSGYKDKRGRVRDTPHYDDIVKDTDIVDMTSHHIYTVRDVLDSIARLAGDLPDDDEVEGTAEVIKPQTGPQVDRARTYPSSDSSRQDLGHRGVSGGSCPELHKHSLPREFNSSIEDPPRTSTPCQYGDSAETLRRSAPQDTRPAHFHMGSQGDLRVSEVHRTYPNSPESQCHSSHTDSRGPPVGHWVQHDHTRLECQHQSMPGNLWGPPQRHSVHYAVHDLLETPASNMTVSRPSSHYYSPPCPPVYSSSRDSLHSQYSEGSQQAVWSQAINATEGTLCWPRSGVWPAGLNVKGFNSRSEIQCLY